MGSMTVGVIIGRFQVDEIHSGHLQLIKWVHDRHERMLILLGCKHAPADQANPLSFPVRELMLRPYAPNAVILPVFDHPSDTAWSAQVDSLVSGVFPNAGAVLYGGRESFIPHYTGRFATRQLDFGNDVDSGTSLRRGIGVTVRNTPDFRAGVIHALHNLTHRIYLAVDIAVVKHDEVLLGRKSGEPAWRFPGGHVDLKDASLEAAARRELSEETGLSVEGALTYVGSFSIDDWRSRGAKDCKHLTALFVAPYSFGTPRAADDLADLQWTSLDRLARQSDLVMPVHQPLVSALLGHQGVRT